MIKNWNKIGYSEINELLGNQDEFNSNSYLKIILKKENNHYGEIDQVFLAYSILFLKKYTDLKIEINFTEPIDEGRFFSFASQLIQTKHLYKFITDESFIIVGSFVNKNTGEILECKNYNSLSQSSSFIPPILICKFDNPIENSIYSYFDKEIDLNDELTHSYQSKLIVEVKSLVESSNTTSKQSKYINDLEKKTSSFSLIKLCLLRVLIEKESNSIFHRKGSPENIKTLDSLIAFCNNLITGLRELAKNVIEHSSSNGVITIRKYNKSVIQNLKADDENSYFNLKKNIDIQRFLDINVIDLGAVDIKNKYVESLETSKESFLESLKSRRTDYKDKVELYQELENSISISFNDDIEIIKDKEFPFYKLFIKNKLDGVNHLSVQKNKLISKIGLQYFTTIVKDKYDGFIKISSISEKAVLYKTNKGEEFNVKNNNEFIHFGTFYNCIVPLKKWEDINTSIVSNKTHSISQDSNSFNELSNLNYISSKEEISEKYKVNEKNIIDFTAVFKNSFNSTKYDDFFNLFFDIETLEVNNSLEFSRNDIIAISCNELQKDSITNASHWIRFIWTLANFFQNIILYDIDLKYYKSIIGLRRSFHDNDIDLWEDDSRVLFYSKKGNNSKNEYYRYGVNILAGKNELEYNFLNTSIWKHHYSFKGEDIFEINKDTTIQTSKHLESVLFSKKGNLHYFEVLLKTSTLNENKISLFEKSVQYSLNTLLEEKQTSDTNNKGYKINNTHFRLGSKIHISDFYYAKKLFQNSFFTTPLAYIIANNIWQTYFQSTSKSLLNIEVNSFTIVGYENYSSFLISSIRNFLDKKRRKEGYNNVIINHLTIDKDAQLSREKHKLQKNVLIIVPIASSFNTSLKIEDQLNYIINRAESLDFEKVNIIEPIQNVVLVANRDKSESKFLDKHIDKNNHFKADSIFKKYNWESVNPIEKTITIKRYNYTTEDDKNREQKYLIPVYTKWQEATECSLCYPTKEVLNEKCLIETGQASITPQIIFGFPRTKKYHSILNEKETILSLEGSLLYGNLKNKDNKYLYFNRTGKVIEDNISEITTWIQKLRNKFENPKNEKDEEFKNDFINKKVVIITPNTGSRSRFLDLINEFLFEYTANCIIISLKEDYIENAETLYSDGLHNAQTIIYVDDVLSTAKSFLEANYIIKYIRNKNQNGEGINYCISLINRMAFADEDNLLLKLKPLDKETKIQTEERLLYYYKINNPTIEESNKKFPLKIEREKYTFLEKNSALDEIRKYFNAKKINIKSQNLKKSPPSIIKDYSLDFLRKDKKRNKKLFQLLVLNSIYSIFEYEIPKNKGNDLTKGKIKSEYEKSRLRDLNNYFPKVDIEFSLAKESDELIIINSIEHLRADIISKLKKDEKHRHIISENENNIDYVVLKVICSTPLIYYKQIRETSFYWVLILIKNKLTEIGNLKNPEDFYKINENSDYNFYQDLKFLLKKSVKLNSNFIIHKSTLDSFKNLIDNLEKIDKVITEKIKKIINPSFKNELEEMCLNEKYLSVPTIKLKLYDFVQNNLKDSIFDSIEFNKRKLSKDGFDFSENTNIDKKEKTKLTTGFHKNLIKEYNSYRESIPEEQINLLSEITQPLVKKEHKPILQSFEQQFEKLSNLPRYKLSSPKNFITHIVALVQELVFQHETKSIKLDKVIDEIRKDEKNFDKNCNDNGTYFHFIRLLHLENIEIINKYSSELINNYSNEIESNLKATTLVQENALNKNLKNHFVPKSIIYESLKINKKYIELCEMQHETPRSPSSIDSFIALKKYIKDLMMSEGNEDKIQDKIKTISTKLKNIIGANLVEDIFFTINYKDIQNYKLNDIYTFSLNDNSNSREELINYENSLTSLMGNEDFKTDDNNLFSHFEVIKHKENLVCREVDKIKTLIENSLQYQQLEDNKSILLIRISDFKEKTFNTLGVITIYLNHSERLKEKKLRLLLALRQDLGNFIKKKTIGTTFLELLQSKKRDEFQGLLRHSIRTYLTNQSNIFEELLVNVNNSSETNELEILTVLNNAIGGQTDNFELISESVIYPKEIIYTYLQKLLRTDYLGNGIEPSYYKIEINTDYLTIHKTIYDVIIPELIYNLKKYTPIKQIDKNVSIIISRNEIVIENNINKFRATNKNKGEGRRMCDKILSIYKNEKKYELDGYEIPSTEFNIYKTILKMKDNERT